MPLVLDPALVRKYDLSGPRYTSLPDRRPLPRRVRPRRVRRRAARAPRGAPAEPLSLYVHVPFCATLCFYCACNKVVTRDRSRGTRYVRYVEREIDTVAALLAPGEAPVVQLHLGGGRRHS
jgi:oxygen-independent coproporphyrinogen-3 oxidase